MLGKASSPLLVQAEQGVQSKVPANMQSALERVVHAGVTVMYSSQLQKLRMERMAKSSDPAKEAGDGAVRLIANLFEQSKRTMPPEVIGPSAEILAMEYLDLMAKAGKAKITSGLIEQATLDLHDALMPAIRTPDGQTAQQIVAAKQGQAQPQQAVQPTGIIGAARAA